MTNLPDAELRELLRSAEAFPLSAQFARYQRVFCRRFASHAPKAWGELLELQQHAVDYCTAEPDSHEKRDSRVRILRSVDFWADQFGISSWWIKSIGFCTLLAYVLADSQGIDKPTSLVQALEPEFHETQEGEGLMVFAPVEVDPFAEFTFLPPIEPLVWDPLVETSAQFQKRSLEAYGDWLHGELVQAQEKLALEPFNVNTSWVEWLILRRAASQSVNSIAKQYGVERGAVDYGIEEARTILAMEDHKTTPMRFRRDQT